MKNYKLIEARDQLGLSQNAFVSKLQKTIDISYTGYVYKEIGKTRFYVDESIAVIKVLNEVAKEKGKNITFAYDDIFLTKM